MLQLRPGSPRYVYMPLVPIFGVREFTAVVSASCVIDSDVEEIEFEVLVKDK